MENMVTKTDNYEMKISSISDQKQTLSRRVGCTVGLSSQFPSPSGFHDMLLILSPFNYKIVQISKNTQENRRSNKVNSSLQNTSRHGVLVLNHLVESAISFIFTLEGSKRKKYPL